MSIQRDSAVSAGRARVLERGPKSSMATKYNPVGEIYYQSALGFRGFDGWRPVHFDNYTATPPVGLANHPLDSDTDSMVLNLSTGEKHYAASNVDNTCVTFRSISFYTPKRFLKFSARIALFDGGFSQSWRRFGLLMDMQRTDNSSRSFPRFCAQPIDGPDWTQWFIYDDTGTAIPIPGTEHLITGANENKMGTDYISWTWDLAANGGLGGYHECQIQDQVFDLTGLGGGSAATAPQIGSYEINDFNGGVNLGLFVDRSALPSQVDVYPAGLRVCNITFSGHDLEQ